MTNRGFKQQRWHVMQFFTPLDQIMRHTLTRKRFRHWVRQYRKENARRLRNLEKIDVRPWDF